MKLLSAASQVRVWRRDVASNRHLLAAFNPLCYVCEVIAQVAHRCRSHRDTSMFLTAASVSTTFQKQNLNAARSNSNSAYMVRSALAWNLKSWHGSLMPDRQRALELVRMEFRRFLHAIVLLPAQIVPTR